MSNLNSEKPEYKGCAVYSMVITACMGSFFFGYNLAVLNNILEYATTVVFPGLDGILQFFMTSFLPLGGGFGAYLAGGLSDTKGRRKAMIITDIISIIGLSIQLIPISPFFLLVGRLIAGVCVGLNSTLVPQYINEIAPVNIRGTAGSLHQVLITIGVTIAFVIASGLPQVSSNKEINYFWFIILGLPIITSSIRIVMLSCVYTQDTARFCIMNENQEDARKMLLRIYGEEIAEVEEQKLLEQKEEEQIQNDGNDKGWPKTKGFKGRFRSGILLAIFQLISGIDALIFFSNQIFRDTAGADSAKLYTDITGILQIVTALISSQIIDRAGRKFLAVGGSFAMGITLAAFSIISSLDSMSPALSYLIFTYIFFFGLSMGPVVWPYIAELLYDKGIHVAILCNWATSFIIAQTFQPLLNTIGASSSFLIFTIGSFISVIVIALTIPETKGKSEKEIDYLFAGSIKTKITASDIEPLCNENA